MTDPFRPAGSLTVYLWAVSLLAGLLVGAAAVLWPPSLSATGLSLAVLFAFAESHPIQLRYRGRAASIVVSELAVALACVALPIGEAAWVAVVGIVLSVPVVRLTTTYETLRIAPVSRYVLNAAKDVIGLSVLVALTALTRDAGPMVTWGVVVVGLAAHGWITHALVTAAINRSISTPPHRMTGADVVEVLRLTAVLTALAVALAPLLDTRPAWPLVLALTVALVLVSRARMGREMAAFRLRVVTLAVTELAEATTLGDFDRRVLRVVGQALVAGRVEWSSSPVSRSAERVGAEFGDTGSWVIAHDPRLRAPWTALDQELLEAVLVAAAPARRRLELLARTAEAERFAALVLTVAGADAATQLHTARQATEGLISRGGDLTDAERRSLLERSHLAIRRVGAALGDMVALGATDPDTWATGAGLALHVRRLTPDVRVEADNVRVAVSAATVERALDSLVANALQHHRGPGHPEVSVRRDGDRVDVEVLDRGPGLTDEQQATLFEPFSTLTDRRRRRGELGLGLLIARGLAERAGGSLSYAAREGGGAVFTLRFPSAGDDPAEGVQERVVLGPGPDRDPQAPREAGPGREVAHEDALSQ